MPSLHKPRVRSLNFFNREGSRDGNRDSASPSPQPAQPPAQPISTNHGESPAFPRDTPSKEPNSPVLRETPGSTANTTRIGRPDSRTASMVYAWTPPTIGNGQPEQIEELMPVFSFLSSHGNKLYQEGYFLKLNDLDTSGKPNVDRNWTECFAQLVGTVLSLWDAAALDVAGQDGEVAPTFINLADASIKMIETLPTRNPDVQPLQNVLSISTAGKNRYLLHFNSLHSLTQWTAGIRLAMFEHASLQELYTGSLIAGKGKHLNNIRVIMERSKFIHEDWARVRFGAGTPWRRCWCVVSPPDEKEFQKQQHKQLKKRSAYERQALPKGDIKFYDTKKTKKATPIATITDAYSAYAIYPQSKPLIEQSTLVKVEGRITIHTTPESKTEGFVFVMPEVHPAVSGFEMMLRWLFPVYDTFNLYGRPSRLIADTLDARGLMFAMPKERRYGYLDIIDVAGLIHTDGSDKWSEREWRKQMKDLTSKRMSMTSQARSNSSLGSIRAPRNSIGSRNGNNVRYEDNASIRSTPSTRHQHNQSTDAVFSTPKKAGTIPPSGPYPLSTQNFHSRAASESTVPPSPSRSRASRDGYRPSRLSIDQDADDLYSSPPSRGAPPPPSHRYPVSALRQNTFEAMDNQNSSDGERFVPHTNPEEINGDLREFSAPAPVSAPPNFQHQPGEQPRARPNVRPDMRRENSRLSNATMSQLVDASKMNDAAAAGATAAWRSNQQERDGDVRVQGVGDTPSPCDDRVPANHDLVNSGMVASTADNDLQPPERPQVQSRQSSEHSITRKPLPSTSKLQPGLAQAFDNDPISMSDSSVRDNNLNPSYIAVPTAIFPSNDTPDSAPRYSQDNYSSESPDYASTRKSTDTRKSDKSVTRPRAGVLKTVGTEVPPETTQTRPSDDIPEINFGPTQRLTTGTSRPTTPMGRKSPLAFGNHSGTSTLGEEKRQSYFGKSSPAKEPRPTSFRSYSYPDRAMAWQPALTVGKQTPGPGVSAEEFVSQRAEAARTQSGYVPRRMTSINHVENPPVPAKNDSYIRPNSRNVQHTLMQNQQEFTTNLSAREREHVAKITGSPLLVMPNRSKTPDPNVGLIGAIEAREQEKRDAMAGVPSHMVQAAVVQRHQHAQQYAQQQTQQQIHAYQTAQMAYGGIHMQPQQMEYYAGPQYQQLRNTVRPQSVWNHEPSQSMPWMNSQPQPQWAGILPTPQQQQYSMQYNNQQGQYPPLSGQQYDQRYYESLGNNRR